MLWDALKPMLIPCYNLATMAPFLLSWIDVVEELRGHDHVRQAMIPPHLETLTTILQLSPRQAPKRMESLSVDKGKPPEMVVVVAMVGVVEEVEEGSEATAAIVGDAKEEEDVVHATQHHMGATE